MLFSALATTCGEVIETNDASLKFTHTFADGFAVPAEFAFGTALTTRAKLTNCSGHEKPAGTTFQRLGSFDEE